MSADILRFLPKARSGDSDFPAIPTLRSYYASLSEEQKRESLAPVAELWGAPCDLSMDHVDTAPAEYVYVAPDFDGA